LGLDADPLAMSEDFARAMGANGELYPCVLALLEQFGDAASLALVTNGISGIQRARIERTGIGGFFDAIVISAEVDAAKPGTEIFDITFDRLGSPTRASAVMIGDNLRSDIGGGTNYGIGTCWFNQRGAVAGPDDVVTHEITALDQLLPLIARTG
jgi:FMN phosphatase YigB (HAD superfamily)